MTDSVDQAKDCSYKPEKERLVEKASFPWFGGFKIITYNRIVYKDKKPE